MASGKAFLIGVVFLGWALFSYALPVGGLSLTHHAFTDQEKSHIREWFLDTWKKHKDHPSSEELALQKLKSIYEKEKTTLQPFFMSMNINRDQKVVLKTLTAQDLNTSSDKKEAKARFQVRVLFLHFLMRQPELKLSRGGFFKNLPKKGKIKSGDLIKNIKSSIKKLKSPEGLASMESHLKKILFQKNQSEVHKNLIYALTRFLEAYELEINHISQVVYTHSYSHQGVKNRIKAVKKILIKPTPKWWVVGETVGPGLVGAYLFDSCKQVFFP